MLRPVRRGHLARSDSSQLLDKLKADAAAAKKAAETMSEPTGPPKPVVKPHVASAPPHPHLPPSPQAPMLDEFALLPARMTMPRTEPDFELVDRPRLGPPGSSPPHLSHLAPKPTAAPGRPHQLVSLPAFFGSPEQAGEDLWTRPATTAMSAWTPDSASAEWSHAPSVRRRSVSANEPASSLLADADADDAPLEADRSWDVAPWPMSTQLFDPGDAPLHLGRGRMPFRLAPRAISFSHSPPVRELGYRSPRRALSPRRQGLECDASDVDAYSESRASAETPNDETAECVAPAPRSH